MFDFRQNMVVGVLAVAASMGLAAPAAADCAPGSGRLILDAGTTVLPCLAGSGRVTNEIDSVARLEAGSNNEDTTYTGRIYENGGSITFAKIGAGTLTFYPGDFETENLYTGGTEVREGTLAIQRLRSFGSSTGFDSFSDPIEVRKVTLFGGATLQVDETLSAGSDGVGLFLTLACATSGSCGAGTIRVNDDYVFTMSDGIDGAGGLIKSGSGTLVLASGNGWLGETMVNGGILRAGAIDAFKLANTITIGEGGTLDLGGYAQRMRSIGGAGRIVNSGEATAVLALGYGDESSTFAGSLVDGDGVLSLDKIGAGTLTLTGTNSYSGKTSVRAGTLVIGSAGALSINTVIDLADGTTLSFQGVSGRFTNVIRFSGVEDPVIDVTSGTVTLAGVISGGGFLTKTGDGTLALTASETYTGATTVAAGTLEVDGSIAASSLTTVSAAVSGGSAVLAGTGTVGALAVDYGTVAPGTAAAPVATLTAQGDVSFTGNSTYAVTVDGSGASRLAATGKATLAGTVSANLLSSASAPTAGTRYTILSASGGLGGTTFGGLLTYGFGGLSAFLTYDADDVYLQFGPDRQVIADSVTALVRDRQGQMVSGRILGSVLLGSNEQVSCTSACVSAFGSVGSFQSGLHGRAAITDDVTLIGGFAWSMWESGGAQSQSAPMLAAALRWDPSDLGASRPYAELGVMTTPWARGRYSRSYVNGSTTFTGRGTADTSSLSVFGRLGWVARLGATDEVAGSVEAWTGWMRTGAYSETTGADNPLPASYGAALDRMSIAKVGGQWTHLWGKDLETQVNLGVATSFASKSGLGAALSGYGDVTGTTREAVWGEYGLRVGYRFNRAFVVDVFADGTFGEKPVGNTVHGGLGLRYAF